MHSQLPHFLVIIFYYRTHLADCQCFQFFLCVSVFFSSFFHDFKVFKFSKLSWTDYCFWAYEKYLHCLIVWLISTRRPELSFIRFSKRVRLQHRTASRSPLIFVSHSARCCAKKTTNGVVRMRNNANGFLRSPGTTDFSRLFAKWPATAVIPPRTGVDGRRSYTADVGVDALIFIVKQQLASISQSAAVHAWRSCPVVRSSYDEMRPLVNKWRKAWPSLT